VGEVGTSLNHICIPTNSYSQGRPFLHLMEHLIHGDGYLGSLGAMMFANVDRPAGTVFSQGANSFFELMAEHGFEYGHLFEIADAYHMASTETFDWLDETTDIHSHAEVLAIPRGEYNPTPNWSVWQRINSYGYGSLTYDTDVDVDAFLLMGDRGATYRVSLFASEGQDLCLFTYDWVSDASLATADGCSDGAEYPNDSVTMDIEMPSSQRVVLHTLNLLGTGGSYVLAVDNIGDDYPDTLDSFATAQPLGLGVTVDGANDTEGDADIFRYDVPSGAYGDVTFNVTGYMDAAHLEVYAAMGSNQPSASLVADGTDSGMPRMMLNT